MEGRTPSSARAAQKYRAAVPPPPKPPTPNSRCRTAPPSLPIPRASCQREIPQQAKDQVEQDRQAAIRASLIRAGQSVSSGPKIPKPEASVPPHDFKQEKKEENREEKKAAAPQRREVISQGQAASPQRLPQPSRLSTAGNSNGANSGNHANSHANKPPRKPPLSATPARKERKNAAHSLP
jgi:hypothetical protein